MYPRRMRPEAQGEPGKGTSTIGASVLSSPARFSGPFRCNWRSPALTWPRLSRCRHPCRLLATLLSHDPTSSQRTCSAAFVSWPTGRVRIPFRPGTDIHRHRFALLNLVSSPRPPWPGQPRGASTRRRGHGVPGLQPVRSPDSLATSDKRLAPIAAQAHLRQWSWSDWNASPGREFGTREGATAHLGDRRHAIRPLQLLHYAPDGPTAVAGQPYSRPVPTAPRKQTTEADMLIPSGTAHGSQTRKQTC